LFTRDGLLEQMYAAKLYDAHKDTVTVNSLLNASEQQTGSFKSVKPQEARAAISKARRQIARIQTPLASITKRRNEVLAHLDPTSVVNPSGLNSTASLQLRS
jgi:hypothetical protein